MILSVIAENLNWEILTKIQLLLKDGMGLKMESFNIMQVPWKGGHKKKQYIRRNCLKRGAWTVCRFKGGGLAKRGQCTLCRLLALTRLGFPALHSLNQMTDFSTNKYIHNIQIKREKQFVDLQKSEVVAKTTENVNMLHLLSCYLKA